MKKTESENERINILDKSQKKKKGKEKKEKTPEEKKEKKKFKWAIYKRLLKYA